MNTIISRFGFIYILGCLILVHSHFELVSSLLALDATEPVSQLVTQMAHFIRAKEISLKATFFFISQTTNKF